MFTVFDLVQLLGPIMGMIIGGAVGAEFSVVLGIVGALAGGMLGLHLGWLPTKWMIMSARRKMDAFTSADLEAQLNASCWTPNFILLELRSRGEDIGKHLPFVLDLMQHEEPFYRTRGYAALLSAFPEKAQELRAYNPTHSAERCRAAVTAMNPETSV
ncbi:MAG: hypothetical protein ACO1TE_15425 [Prosthecobacter sp.]